MWGRLWKVAGAAGLAIMMAGCAQVELFQPADKALVSFGLQERQSVDVAKYAGNYTPYAIMAALSAIPSFFKQPQTSD